MRQHSFLWNIKYGLHKEPSFKEYHYSRLMTKYDPETKRQYMQLKPPPCPSAKILRIESFEAQGCGYRFFDILGVVMAEWVLSDQTVDNNIINKFWSKCMNVRSELRKDGWIFHQVKDLAQCSQVNCYSLESNQFI